ncbi:sporulation histidine kinase inhibitor Sda [Peribacillus frigoritolerans]|nr:sporulation histidine kinase inhibitor Sda [Peribacillus frigoritolerans]
MQKLSDDLLLESYFKAQNLKLSTDFIRLIETEIHPKIPEHIKSDPYFNMKYIG